MHKFHGRNEVKENIVSAAKHNVLSLPKKNELGYMFTTYTMYSTQYSNNSF